MRVHLQMNKEMKNNKKKLFARRWKDGIKLTMVENGKMLFKILFIFTLQTNHQPYHESNT